MYKKIENIAIVSINEPSFEASQKLKSILKNYNITLYNKEVEQEGFVKYQKLDDILPNLWGKDAIIFLIATGIVVRKIAPFLQDKTKDPAVIVMSIDLLKVMPLLSGHIGGANELSEEICSKIEGAISFVTTATDQTKSFAFDMFAKKNSFEIENIKKLANISNRIINKKEVKVATYEAIFKTLPKNLKLTSFENIDDNTIVISPNFKSRNLTLKPKIYLGLGMNRGVSKEELEEAIELFLIKHNLYFKQIENIASFEAKSDEEGLLEFANRYDFKIKFFSKENINSLEKNFTPSQATKFFDIKGVAEPSALLVSKYKELIIKKEVYNKKITIAGAI